MSGPKLGLESEYMKQQIEIPGIDDCDMLYSLCTRDGNDSVYIRCQEVGDKWYYQCTIDCNTGSFCDNYGSQEGPFDSPEEAAMHALPAAKEWFYDNDVRFVYDNDLRCLVRKARGMRSKPWWDEIEILDKLDERDKESDFRLIFYTNSCENYVSEAYYTEPGETVEQAAERICRKFGWHKKKPGQTVRKARRAAKA
jgi:hypothetical protein